MRRNPRPTAVLALILAVTALAVLAVVSSPRTEAKPKPPGGGGGGPGICECANLDAPVICDGGKIYPNPCVAACVHATNCVPYSDGGGPAVAGIRYCCTPQQVQACSAQGGTTTCRTGVCKCQF